MNEMNMIRELLKEPPSPARQVTADALRRLEDGIAGRRPQRRIRPTALRRRWLLGVSLVAAAAATAVGGIVVLSDTTGPGSSVTLQNVETPKYLLAAAEKAEREPMGKYWFTDQVVAQTYLVKDGYAISAASKEFFKWTAVRSGGGELFSGCDLPARPLTKADEAAWRRAGSPESFQVWSNDHWGTYTTKAGSWDSDWRQAGEGGRFPFSGFHGHMEPMPCPKEVGGSGCKKPVGDGATIQDLLNLPTDPKELAARYLKVPGTDARRSAENNAQRLLRVSMDLQNAPVPPKVRAAMIRMLPSLPGVHPVGQVVDSLGQRGFALAADWPSQGPTYHGYDARTELIFSKNGEFLGDRNVLTRPGGEYRSQKPGFVINYWAVRDSGWTDTKPTLPKKLPF